MFKYRCEDTEKLLVRIWRLAILSDLKRRYNRGEKLRNRYREILRAYREKMRIMEDNYIYIQN